MRRFLAEWLYPEAFKDQRAYEHLLIRARDAFWWLGEFPEACATLRWLIDNNDDWRRPLGEPGVCCWGQGISEFREKLRRGEHLEAAKRRQWQRKANP